MRSIGIELNKLFASSPSSNLKLLVIGKTSTNFLTDLSSTRSLQITEYNFDHSDLYDLQYEDAYFDGIIAIDVLADFKYYKWAIQECTRVLKPEGVMVVSLPYSFSQNRILNIKFWLSKFTNSPERFNKPYYRKKGLTQLLFSLNLKIQYIDSLYIDKTSISKNILGNNLVAFTTKMKDDEIYAKYQDPKIINSIESEELYQKFEHNLKQWKTQTGYQLEPSTEISSQTLNDKKVLVLSPHPDDEVIGCGGICMQILQSSGEVHIIELMDGRETRVIQNDSSISKVIRHQEAKIFAEMMGATELMLWGEIKLDESNINRLSTKLINHIDKIQPDWIFLPFMKDIHPDHVMTNRILHHALLKRPSLTNKLLIFSYEIWGKTAVNTFFGIDQLIHKKMRLLLHFKTAMKAMDYADYCHKLNTYNSWKLRNKAGSVEVFQQLLAKDWIELSGKYFSMHQA